MVGNVDSILFEPAVFYGYCADCTDELPKLSILFYPASLVASGRKVCLLGSGKAWPPKRTTENDLCFRLPVDSLSHSPLKCSLNCYLLTLSSKDILDTQTFAGRN